MKKIKERSLIRGGVRSLRIGVIRKKIVKN